MSHQPNFKHPASHEAVNNHQGLEVNNSEAKRDINVTGGPVNRDTTNYNIVNKTINALPYVLVLVGLTYAFLGYLNQQKFFPPLQNTQTIKAAVGDSISNARVTSPTPTSVAHHYHVLQSMNKRQEKPSIPDLDEEANTDHKTYTSLRKALAEPAQVFRLRLYRKNLLTLPESIGTLYNLQKLYLTSNELKDLPQSFTRLEKLTHLYARQNRFKKFPEILLAMPKLTYLYLSKNNLRKIPDEITQMQGLQILHLSENRLKSLPKSIAQLKNLRILYLKGNPINDQEKEKIRRWLPGRTIFF